MRERTTAACRTLLPAIASLPGTAQRQFCPSVGSLPSARGTPTSANVQVRRPVALSTHFTLHGLWPRPRRKQYCNVSQALIDADEKGDWQALPAVGLSTETRTRLDVVMPGTQSFLDRHEWIKHGTCYSGSDADTYFREAVSLIDEVNHWPSRHWLLPMSVRS